MPSLVLVSAPAAPALTATPSHTQKIILKFILMLVPPPHTTLLPRPSPLIFGIYIFIRPDCLWRPA